jgi:hypothetical protein
VPPTDLLGNLCSSVVKVKRDLDQELERRGLTATGNKEAKAEAIVWHVTEHPDGYHLAKEMDGQMEGAEMPLAPCGFTGEKPPIGSGVGMGALGCPDVSWACLNAGWSSKYAYFAFRIAPKLKFERTTNTSPYDTEAGAVV